MSAELRPTIRVSLWSARRLAYGVLPLLSALEKHDVHLAPILRRADVDEFGLYDPTYTIEIDQELRLLKQGFAAVDDPAFGLELASCYSLRSFSALGLAIQASQNLAEVLQLVTQFPQLAWGVSDVKVEFSDAEVALQFEPHPLLGSLGMDLVERDMLCALNILCECLAQRIQPIAVQLIRPQPLLATQARYQRCFGRTPQWSQQSHQLRFKLWEFKQPLPQADQRIQRFYRAQCQHMVEVIHQPFSFAQNILQRLHQASPIPNLSTLAQHMWLSPRTLQRRLKAEHTSFSQLLQRARLERAFARLQEPQTSLAGLAAELGFSDEVAFSHAFQSWTGTSPRAWQKTAGQSPTGIT